MTITVFMVEWCETGGKYVVVFVVLLVVVVEGECVMVSQLRPC